MARPAAEISREERRREWARYYSDKRFYEQLLQVHLLVEYPITKVLEIGPYLGLVTAMLDNAGYEVTTMDLNPPSFHRPVRPHIEMNLAEIDPARLAGFDCIVCCATLEHIPYARAVAALRAFRASGAPYVLVSIPYQGPQLFYQLYVNGKMLASRFSWKKLRSLKEFPGDADPMGHKWEIGYKGRSLQTYEAMLKDLGFEILRRSFSYPSLAVFHMLGNTR